MFLISEGNVKFNPQINVKTLKTIQAEPRGVQLFDVRNPSELVEDGKLPGAVNIPREFADNYLNLVFKIICISSDFSFI